MKVYARDNVRLIKVLQVIQKGSDSFKIWGEINRGIHWKLQKLTGIHWKITEIKRYLLKITEINKVIN